ncbi:hypothetical protein [Streptomyces sp. A30]|uniref:hypothetical protein n=1 Tax=Streptomyces sp. A30 TaxID=2789273 RepID=UPI0039813612
MTENVEKTSHWTPGAPSPFSEYERLRSATFDGEPVESAKLNLASGFASLPLKFTT